MLAHAGEAGWTRTAHLIGNCCRRMLNDRVRNEAFAGAIGRAVARGRGGAVLDIGAGTGLLTLLALRAGATPPVTAVEASPAMAAIAAATLERNGARMPGAARLLRGRSTALRVPMHLPRRASLLVSEVVDSGLLGEGVLPTLRHALRELLAVDGQCIPAGAVVAVEPVQCAALRDACVVSRDAAAHGGVDAARLAGASGGCVGEGYTCETRAHLPGLASLGPPTPVLAFCFGAGPGGSAAAACRARMSDAEAALPCVFVGADEESAASAAAAHILVACDGVLDAFALTWRLFLDADSEVRRRPH